MFFDNTKPDVQRRREEWDALTRMREDAIAAEKKVIEKRRALEKDVAERQKGEFLQETKQGEARAQQREEWREDKHADRLATEKKRRQQEEIAKNEAEIERKKKERLASDQERMADLHKKAVEKRVNDKIQGARSEEEKQKRQVTEREVRTIGVIDQEAARKIEHIEREAKQKKDSLNMRMQHDNEEALETFRTEKKKAEQESAEKLRDVTDESERRAIRLEENQAISQAEARRKRVMVGAEESLRQKLLDIDVSTKRLVDEIQRESQQRRAREQVESGKHRKEAEARRERTEEWFGKGE